MFPRVAASPVLHYTERCIGDSGVEILGDDTGRLVLRHEGFRPILKCDHAGECGSMRHSLMSSRPENNL